MTPDRHTDEEQQDPPARTLSFEPESATARTDRGGTDGRTDENRMAGSGMDTDRDTGLADTGRADTGRMGEDGTGRGGTESGGTESGGTESGGTGTGRMGTGRMDQDRMDQDRMDQDRTGQDRTGQDRTGEHRMGEAATGTGSTGTGRTGTGRTGESSMGESRRDTGRMPGGEDRATTHGGGATSAGHGDERERLVPADRAEAYSSRWDEVKGAFVDEPRQAVAQADELVGELLDEMENLFREQRRHIERGLDADETSTEDLRLALGRYRSFFDRLLSL